MSGALFALSLYVSRATFCAEIQPTKLARCAKSVRQIALVIGAVVAAAALPTGYHDNAAKLQGKTHIDYGIYYEANEIFQKNFTSEERDLLFNRYKDPKTVKQIASLIASKLNGNYVNDHAPFPSARDASEFLSGNSKNQGACREKACLGANMLQSVGINAEEAFAENIETGEGHAFIVLPDYQIVVEATWDSMKSEGFVLSIDEYEQRLKSLGMRRTFDEQTFFHKATRGLFGGTAR